MSASAPAEFPQDPPLVAFTRGSWTESQVRGAWAVVDVDGRILDGEGANEASFFARSTLKGLQVLPLLESGAAERFEMREEEVALACASHAGEPQHVAPVLAFLERLGLGVADLRCGSQPPTDPDARYALRSAGKFPTAAHNNCSGKHAGFLALALHLGVPTADYLSTESASQRLVRDAIRDMTGAGDDELKCAIDGCSAPTYRLPLAKLGRAFARLANPDGLPEPRHSACLRVLEAVAAHPELIAGVHRRLCTAIGRVTRGRLFPKLGGDAVYVVGERGGDRALAVKLDDGSLRGLDPLVVELLERLEFVSAEEARGLEQYRQRELRNWAGTKVGETRVVARCAKPRRVPAGGSGARGGGA